MRAISRFVSISGCSEPRASGRPGSVTSSRSRGQAGLERRRLELARGGPRGRPRAPRGPGWPWPRPAAGPPPAGRRCRRAASVSSPLAARGRRPRTASSASGRRPLARSRRAPDCAARRAARGESSPGPRWRLRAATWCVRDLGDAGERRRIAHGDVGQDLPIEGDAGGLEAGDELAVGEAVLASGGVQADDPQGPHLALALLAADVRVRHRVEQRLARRLDQPRSRAAPALRRLRAAACGAGGR